MRVVVGILGGCKYPINNFLSKLSFTEIVRLYICLSSHNFSLTLSNCARRDFAEFSPMNTIQVTEGKVMSFFSSDS